ncbi:unnamed protein product [Clonostachys solani]|uniref:Uncharacterized protein n=1 Tax=Clonostachys solani TaxID=160281 RepID=A0A9N9Z8G1_9HYPO|nr:unnamed protein product [Clonostachys solani]
MPVQLLERFKRITFDVEKGDVFRWRYCQPEWPRLISFLGKYYNPSNLLISINATHDLAIANRFVINGAGEPFLRDIYDAYVEIARSIKKGFPGLGDFHLSFSIFLQLEPVLEKFVMGPDYDSSRGNRYSKARNIKWQIPDAAEYLTEIPAWHKDVPEL